MMSAPAAPLQKRQQNNARAAAAVGGSCSLNVIAGWASKRLKHNKERDSVHWFSSGRFQEPGNLWHGNLKDLPAFQVATVFYMLSCLKTKGELPKENDKTLALSLCSQESLSVQSVREEHITSSLSVPVGKGEAHPSRCPAAQMDCLAGGLRGRRLQDHGTCEKDGEVLTSHTRDFQRALHMKVKFISGSKLKGLYKFSYKYVLGRGSRSKVLYGNRSDWRVKLK